MYVLCADCVIDVRAVEFNCSAAVSHGDSLAWHILQFEASRAVFAFHCFLLEICAVTCLQFTRSMQSFNGGACQFSVLREHVVATSGQRDESYRTDRNEEKRLMR